MARIDITGKKFGMLSAIEFVEVRDKNSYWKFRCDCGNEKIICANNVVRGMTKSCGCHNAKVASQNLAQWRLQNPERHREVLHNNGKMAIKHGGSYTRLYRIFCAMRQRCGNPNNKKYRIYGGKGICVCDAWKDFEAFREWAMATGYTDEMTIDRIDPSKGYSPENCQWLTMEEHSKKTARDQKFGGRRCRNDAV